MDKKIQFWDRVAAKYAKRKITNEEAYQKKLEQTQAYLTPETKMLELACGTGTTALHLAPYVEHIKAVDLSLNMLEIAKEKAQKSGIENITFSCCDIEAEPLPEQSYDVILAHSILHLLQEREPVLQKIYKALKPGGVFISSTACLGKGFWWLKMIIVPGAFFGLLPSIRFFTDTELKEQFCQTGFEIIEDWQPSKAQALFMIARKPTGS
jgi:ubiquinone/menaquinone biosynthesis C-methylase UbiE